MNLQIVYLIASSYLATIKTTHGRNELFPFLIGLLLVAGGSASTLFYYFAAAYVMFFNPQLSLMGIGSRVLRIYRKFPVLLVLPLFVFSLFAFSIGRDNSGNLLETLASHFQLLFIVPITVGIRAISDNKECLAYFVNGLGFGVMLILPVALLQVTVFDTRPEGLSGNSLIFAFVLCVACVLGLLHDEEKTGSRVFLGYLPSICAFIMIIISFSRAPILMVFALTLITLIFYVRRKLSLKKFLSVILLFAITTIIGVMAVASTDFGALYFDKRIIEPITNLSKGKLSDNSIRKRIGLNVSGLHAFSQNPLVGYGLQNTVEAANLASKNALGDETSYEFSHLHNEYLTYAVAGGSFILLQYLLILLLPLLISRKQTNWDFSILVVISFAGIALTNVVLGHDIMSTFFSMCLIIILVNRMNNDTLIMHV